MRTAAARLGSGRVRIGEPPGRDAEKRAPAIEMVVAVKDVESGGLRGDDDAGVGQRESVRAVGAGLGEDAHSRYQRRVGFSRAGSCATRNRALESSPAAVTAILGSLLAVEVSVAPWSHPCDGAAAHDSRTPASASVPIRVEGPPQAVHCIGPDLGRDGRDSRHLRQHVPCESRRHDRSLATDPALTARVDRSVPPTGSSAGARLDRGEIPQPRLRVFVWPPGPRGRPATGPGSARGCAPPARTPWSCCRAGPSPGRARSTSRAAASRRA